MRASLLTLLCILLYIPGDLTAQETKRMEDRALVVRRTANFDITGKGSAGEWNKAEWLPMEKRKGRATYRTRAKLLYSDTGIYGLFSNEDNKINATFREDFAQLWTEDVVEIFLWTDTATSIYFEYELSPLNYELPILVPNMDGDFLGWRPWQYEGERKIRHATHIVKDQEDHVREWIAEFFIPYALLKPLKNVPPKKGTEWRVNMYRNDYDQEYTSWSWKPVQKNYHDYEKFGVIRFE